MWVVGVGMGGSSGKEGMHLHGLFPSISVLEVAFSISFCCQTYICFFPYHFSSMDSVPTLSLLEGMAVFSNWIPVVGRGSSVPSYNLLSISALKT